MATDIDLTEVAEEMTCLLPCTPCSLTLNNGDAEVCIDVGKAISSTLDKLLSLSLMPNVGCTLCNVSVGLTSIPQT
jgi:hypothetical protein